MKKRDKTEGATMNRADELALLREDDDFICRVLSFLPAEMKQGYVSDDSDGSDAEDDLPKSREERQAALREKLHAKLQSLRARSGSLRAQKSLRRRLNKMEKRKENQKQKAKGGAINSKINAVKTAKKQKMIERRSKGGLPTESMKPKPVFNTEGKLVFSKFDFASSGTPEKPKTKKVSLKTELHRAREKQQRKQQKDSGEVDSEAWETAMRKATGEKIRDDPKLIQKTMKRQQQKKKQSKKKWDERIQNEKKKQGERQNKRMSNIQDRRDKKEKKRVNKLKKKGRILPGF